MILLYYEGRKNESGTTEMYWHRGTFKEGGTFKWSVRERKWRTEPKSIRNPLLSDFSCRRPVCMFLGIWQTIKSSTLLLNGAALPVHFCLPCFIVCYFLRITNAANYTP